MGSHWHKVSLHGQSPLYSCFSKYLLQRVAGGILSLWPALTNWWARSSMLPYAPLHGRQCNVPDIIRTDMGCAIPCQSAMVHCSLPTMAAAPQTGFLPGLVHSHHRHPATCRSPACSSGLQQSAGHCVWAPVTALQSSLMLQCPCTCFPGFCRPAALQSHTAAGKVTVLLCWPADGSSMRLHQYLNMTAEVSGSSAALGHLMTEQQFLEAHLGLGLKLERTETPAQLAE